MPEETASQGLPLAGTFVIDLSQFLSGPSAALRLADMGADVIKIERPGTGDSTRQLALADQWVGEDSLLFHTINRGKRSYTADLKTERDRQAFLDVVRHADVLIHNFRPGVMERLGLGYELLSTIRPELVMAGVSGYGPVTAWAGRPGQDLLVQAVSGLTMLSGDPSAPVPMGVSLIDMTAGSQLVQGILALLLRRVRTGRGGRVDVSLLEAAIDLQFEGITAWLNGAEPPERSDAGGASAYLGAPYGVFAAKDGWLAIAMTDRFRLVRALDDPALNGILEEDWWIRRDDVRRVLATVIVQRNRDSVLAALDKHDVWCAPVMDWPALFADDLGLRDVLTQRIAAADRNIVTTRCPITIDGTKLDSRSAAPKLGATIHEWTPA